MSYYTNGELIEALSQYPKEYPVMIECDHGQWPEDVYSLRVLYRRKDREDDQEYGSLEDMMPEDGYGEDELEKFILIN